MAEKNWYVHSGGVTFGPLPTKVVKVMLEQRRLSLTEFIWGEGMARWERIRDKFEFGGEQLPPYPDAPIPSEDPGGGTPSMDEASEEASANEEPEGEAEAEAVEAEPEPAVAAAAAAPAAAPKPKAAAKPAAKPAAKGKPDLKVVPPMPAEAPSAPPKPANDAGAWTIRRSPRVAIKGAVKTQEFGALEIMDISETGTLVRAPKSIAPGTQLDFDLESDELEKSPLHMTGIVARSLFAQGKDCVAIEFIRVNPAHKRILNAFVTSKAKEGVAK